MSPQPRPLPRSTSHDFPKGDDPSPFAHANEPGLLGFIVQLERGVVPRDRIELSTPAFSGLCSTN
jgi:hypothetical protein